MNPTQTQARPLMGRQSATGIKDRLSDVQSSGYASSATDFYGNNSDEITGTTVNIAEEIDVSAMKDRINVFAESSKVLMKVLDEVQKMHPFIGVAVIAFKAVVSLELKRRDNDDSVLTLLVKMEDMMGELLLLKIIEPDALRGGKTVAATLSGVCTLIAEDIKNCGNLCDKYSKTSFCGKLLKSPLYNERFSKFIQLFETWMRELDRKLGLFTAITVHSLSVSMDQVYTTLQSNNEHMKTLILLQRLQSPLEQKILKAIKRHGGSEACMADDKIIEELIAMTPQGKGLRNTLTAFPAVRSDQTQTNTASYSFNKPQMVPSGYDAPYMPVPMPRPQTPVWRPATPDVRPLSTFPGYQLQSGMPPTSPMPKAQSQRKLPPSRQSSLGEERGKFAHLQ